MIEPIINKPGYWLVPSTTDPDKTYQVHARSGACECESWLWRHSKDYTLCKHGKALKAHLDALAACPQCGGRGFYITAFRFQSGSDPIPCGTCDGTGRRADADPRLAAMWDRENADARERSLKETFG